MKDLLKEINTSVHTEYGRAVEKFGKKNNSAHESYAVILEEFEEAMESTDRFEKDFDYYWQGVKGNQEIELMEQRLDWMKAHAEEAAAEWVQVAAMCYKAKQSL